MLVLLLGHGMTGGLIGDTVIICGGIISDISDWNSFANCYSLTFEKATLVTHMSVRRSTAASIVFNDNALWITGGFNHNVEVLASTEYVTMTKTMSGPDLPIALQSHTMVAINKTFSMIIGGGHGEAANYCLFNSFYVRNSKFFFLFGKFNFI